MGYLGKFVYLVVYSGLAITACSIIFFGPLTYILNDETVYTEHLQILKGIIFFILLYYQIDPYKIEFVEAHEKIWGSKIISEIRQNLYYSKII